MQKKKKKNSSEGMENISNFVVKINKGDIFIPGVILTFSAVETTYVHVYIKEGILF